METTNNSLGGVTFRSRSVVSIDKDSDMCASDCKSVWMRLSARACQTKWRCVLLLLLLNLSHLSCQPRWFVCQQPAKAHCNDDNNNGADTNTDTQNQENQQSKLTMRSFLFPSALLLATALVTDNVTAFSVVTPSNNGRVSTTTTTLEALSRRDALMASGTVLAGLALGPGAALAATAPPTPAEIERIRTGYKTITYLLDNFEQETTGRGMKNRHEWQTVMRVCVRDRQMKTACPICVYLMMGQLRFPPVNPIKSPNHHCHTHTHTHTHTCTHVSHRHLVL